MPEDSVGLGWKKKIPIIGGWVFPDLFSGKDEWVGVLRTPGKWVLCTGMKKLVDAEESFTWDGDN